MTAPNKMAKRAAAGTLALAVCFTGGLVAATSASAALPTFGAGNTTAVNVPGTGNATPVVVQGAAGDTRSVRIELGTSAFDTKDRILVQLPNGFDFNNTIVATQVNGTPTTQGDADAFTATTGPAVTDISSAFTVSYLAGATPTQRVLVITPNVTRAALEARAPNPLASSDSVSLTLGVRPASPASNGSPAVTQRGAALNIDVPADTDVSTINATVVSQTEGTTAGQFTTNGTFDVTIAQTSESAAFAASAPANQNVTLGSGAQTVGPITLQEVAANVALNGTYTVQFRDSKDQIVKVDTADSSDALDPDFDAGSTGYTGTVTPTGDGNSFTVVITGAGAAAGSPEQVQLKNLRIVPQAGLVGPITAFIDNGTDEVEAANGIDILTINDRLAGTDRYGTAAQVARKTANLGAENFPSLADGVSNVVLVNSGYGKQNGQAIDALTANYVAGGQARAGRDVPILLSGADSIPAVTTDAIRYVFGSNVSTGTNNYANKTITIVGGPDAVSDNVVKAMRDYLPGVRVDRVSGDDRYATAANAVTQTATSAGAGDIVTYTTEVGKPGLRTAVLASGEEAVDALSAGPYSYAKNLPLLLSRQDSLPLETENALRQLGIKNVLLLGGPNAVSAGVESKLKDLGITVNRINGADRYETSTLFQTFVASPSKSAAQPGFNGLALQDDQNRYFGNASEVFLANGVTFADALVTGPLAGSRGEPLVITEANNLNDYSKNFITAGSADEVFPIGGVQVLEESVVSAAKAAADGGDGIDGLPENGSSPFGDPNATAPITGLEVSNGKKGNPAATPATPDVPLNVTFSPFASGSFQDVSSITYTLDSTTNANDSNGEVTGGATARRAVVDAEAFSIPVTGVTADTYVVTVTIVADGETYTSSVPGVVVAPA